MPSLAEIAPTFVELAHQIVWCSAATVDAAGRPRSRVLHPYWQWDGETLVGWIATSPSPKLAHLTHSPYVSCNYWVPSQDTCLAECRVDWVTDDETRTMVWNLFVQAPPPLGYDPGAIGVPGWESPTSPGFAVMRLRPWRVRTLRAEVFMKQGPFGATTWREQPERG